MTTITNLISRPRDVSWNASRDPLRIVRIQSDEPIGFSASRGRELFVGEGGNLHGPFVKPGEGRAAHHNMAAEKQANARSFADLLNDCQQLFSTWSRFLKARRRPTAAPLWSKAKLSPNLAN